MDKQIKITAFLVSIMLLVSCSGAKNDAKDTIFVTSEPSGSEFKIKNRKGEILAYGTTPQEVELRKTDLDGNRGEAYVLTYSFPETKQTLTKQTTQTPQSMNLGLYIIDPSTGKVTEVNKTKIIESDE